MEDTAGDARGMGRPGRSGAGRPARPGAGRWQALEAIFHAAAALGPDARRSYLRDACDGEPALEREVRRLLAASDRADRFIAGLILRKADEVGRSGDRADADSWPEYDRPEHDRPGHDRPGHDQPGHNRPAGGGAAAEPP